MGKNVRARKTRVDRTRDARGRNWQCPLCTTPLKHWPDRCLWCKLPACRACIAAGKCCDVMPVK